MLFFGSMSRLTKRKRKREKETRRQVPNTVNNNKKEMNGTYA